MILRRLFLLAAALAPALACAQAYPTRSITLVVPFAAGGPTDVVARTLGAVMQKSLGQTVVIENKLGAGGTLAAGYVAKAAPDGYTFLIHHNGMATAPGLYRKLAYNPLTDFEYVSQVVDVPMTLLARKDLPAATPRRCWPSSRPRQQADAGALPAWGGVAAVRHAVPEAGGRGADHRALPGHCAGAERAAGGASGPAVRPDHADAAHIKAGSVKLYGVTTSQRIRSLPDTPTLDESGLKGFEVKVWHGIYAPKGTPAAVIDRFGGALRAALKDPTVQQRMTELGADIVPKPSRPPKACAAGSSPRSTSGRAHPLGRSVCRLSPVCIRSTPPWTCSPWPRPVARPHPPGLGQHGGAVRRHHRGAAAAGRLHRPAGGWATRWR